MTKEHLLLLRRRLNDLDTFIERAAESPNEYDRVLTVRLLCRSLSEAARDNYCSEQLDLIELYAGDLFSEAEHRGWERGPQSGADVLKHKIAKCRGTIEARLMALGRAAA